MKSPSKIAWHGRNLLNFTIACARIFFYCLCHPRQAGKLAFPFFSLINEFYQSSHGKLLPFEETQTFRALKERPLFAQTSYFHCDPQVMRPVESQVLAALTTHFAPRTVFEIGTYSGLTALNFAYNSPAEARIYTLDLPETPSDIVKYSYDDHLVVQLSRENVHKRAFKDHAMEPKITELFGNSMHFDFSPYYGRIDLVFIDGSHAGPYVASDTANAFKMLSPNGVIVWHDFDYIIHRDVFKYLNNLSKEHRIYSIPHTRFAIYGRNL